MTSDLNAWKDGQGHVVLSGLPSGQHTVVIYDALGQLVWLERVGANSTIALINWRVANSVGLYVLHVVGVGSVRLIGR
jgi:hypothetical protein